MQLPFSQFAQSAPLFTLEEARARYKKDKHNRSLLNLLHRLKHQGRVRLIANGVYAGAFAATPLNRYRVPLALREDAVVALHSALELHGVANQVFQTVYYFSARARKDVVFDRVTYHRVAPPRALLAPNPSPLSNRTWCRQCPGNRTRTILRRLPAVSRLQWGRRRTRQIALHVSFV